MEQSSLERQARGYAKTPNNVISCVEYPVLYLVHISSKYNTSKEITGTVLVVGTIILNELENKTLYSKVKKKKDNIK